MSDEESQRVRKSGFYFNEREVLFILVFIKDYEHSQNKFISK